MSLRCGCPGDRDDAVFGPDHICTDGQGPAGGAYYVPSWLRWVSTTRDVIAATKMLTRQDFTLSPPELLPERTAMPGERLPPLPPSAYPPDAIPLPEPRYLETLDEAERTGH